LLFVAIASTYKKTFSSKIFIFYAVRNTFRKIIWWYLESRFER